MKKITLLISGLFLLLAWLTRDYNYPWVNFTAQFYGFLFLIPLLIFYINKKIIIPIITLPLFLLAFIPILHYFIGKIIFFSTAFFGFIYILSIFIALILGFNFCKNNLERTNFFNSICNFMAFSGFIVAMMAIVQFFNYESIFNFISDNSKYQRPFANFAQPNNMATFLLISGVCTSYIFLKTNKYSYLFILLIISIGVLLSQSRTAFLSLIVIYIFIVFYNNKNNLKIGFWRINIYLITFILLFVFLPYLNSFLVDIFSLEQKKLINLVSKTIKVDARIEIWKQILVAIKEKVFFGYGWYQTDIVFFLNYKNNNVYYSINSAHNFLLDFILWNGVIVGAPYLIYFGLIFYNLLKQVKDLETTFFILILIPFTCHSMLEFPQNYSYFIFPLVFLIGVFMYKGEFTLILVRRYVIVTLIIYIFFSVKLYNDYQELRWDFRGARNYLNEPNSASQVGRNIFFDSLVARINFYGIDPYKEYSNVEILEFEKIILFHPSEYNLNKFIQILNYNGYSEMSMKYKKYLNLITKN